MPVSPGLLQLVEASVPSAPDLFSLVALVLPVAEAEARSLVKILAERGEEASTSILAVLDGLDGPAEATVLAATVGTLPATVHRHLARSRRVNTLYELVGCPNLDPEAALRIAQGKSNAATKAARHRNLRTEDRVSLYLAADGRYVELAHLWCQQDGVFAERWHTAQLLNAALFAESYPGTVEFFTTRLPGCPAGPITEAALELVLADPGCTVRWAERGGLGPDQIVALIATYEASSAEKHPRTTRLRGVLVEQLMKQTFKVPTGAFDHPEFRDLHQTFRGTWANDATADAASRSVGSIRSAALASPALSPALRAAAVNGSEDEQRAVAFNPSLTTSEAAQLVSTLSSASLWRLFAAPLSIDDRVACLASSPALWLLLARQVTDAGREGIPGWVAAWFESEVVAGALAATRSVIATAYTPWALHAVRLHPHLAEAVAAVAPWKARLPQVAAERTADVFVEIVAGSEARLALFASLIESWDGSVAELIETVSRASA